MQPLLFFRLGESDRPAFGALLGALSNIRRLLQDFDAALSRDPRGMVRWEVAVLEKASPPILGLNGEIVRRRNTPFSPSADFPSVVGRTVLRSTAAISNEGQRPDIVSDSAISHYSQLAASSQRIGEIAVYDGQSQVAINDTTLENIRKLTGPKTKSVGSVLGRLESISVHKNNEIRVWDENSGKPIRCTYPRELEEIVKATLRERVLVSGLVSYNALGQPISVGVRELVRYPAADELPSIEDVTGLIDDVTGGATLRDYLAHIRDD